MAEFGFLMLKALGDTEPQNPQITTRKEMTMFTQTQAEAVIEKALAPIRERIKKAKKAGDVDEERDQRRRLGLAKAMLAEEARARNPQPSRWGPGVTELFTRTGTLPDDSAVKGI